MLCLLNQLAGRFTTSHNVHPPFSFDSLVLRFTSIASSVHAVPHTSIFVSVHHLLQKVFFWTSSPLPPSHLCSTNSVDGPYRYPAVMMCSLCLLANVVQFSPITNQTAICHSSFCSRPNPGRVPLATSTEADSVKARYTP